MVTVGAGSTGSDIIGLVKPAAGMVPASYRVSSLIAFISARIPLREKRNTRRHGCAAATALGILCQEKQPACTQIENKTVAPKFVG